MKIGCTAGLGQYDKIGHIAEAGFDYVETSLVSLYNASEDEISRFTEVLDDHGIVCTAANGLFPSGMMLTGDGFNGSVIEDYLNIAFDKAARVGIDTVAFACGASRRVPREVDRRKVALEQLEEVCLHYLSPVARKN